MKILERSITLFLLLLIFNNCQKKDPEYAALIEGTYEISKQELLDYHKDLYFERRFPESDYRGYEKALEELITRKMKQIDFTKKGLQNDMELMSNIGRVISEELLVLYFDMKYLGQYIDDEVITDYYESLGREVSYQQIAVSKANNEDLEYNKGIAAEIKQQAEKTGDLQKIENQYLNDSRADISGVEQKAMTWEEGTASPQNQVIFRMPEGSVRIIETPGYLLVVRVNEVNNVELRPLEEIRPQIFRILREVYSPRAFADYDRDKANLIDKDNYEWNTNGLNQLVEWSKIDGFYRQDKYKQIIQDTLDSGTNFEILEYENGTVDLKKYLYLLNNVLLIKTSVNATQDDYKQFIDEALRTELIVENARDMGLDKNILSLETNSPIILDEFVRLYDQEFILTKIPEYNEANIQEFYELTKDSLFYQPDKVNLRVKEFTDEAEARAMMDEIRNGKEFEDLFRAWSVKTYIINEEGETEPYLSPEPNYFGDEAFKLEEGETAGPVEYTENGEVKYALIKANNVEKEKILTVDEVLEPRLRRMFRSYYFNKFSNRIAESLRSKYTVEVNEQVLRELSASNSK